jgi:hypothetical protein
MVVGAATSLVIQSDLRLTGAVAASGRGFGRGLKGLLIPTHSLPSNSKMEKVCPPVQLANQHRKPPTFPPKSFVCFCSSFFGMHSKAYVYALFSTLS